MVKINLKIKKWCKKYKTINKLINRFKSWRKTKMIIDNIKLNEAGHLIKYENRPVKYINKPGIALTFDDGYRVNHWYDYGLGKKSGYKDIFGYFDVKATFNINAFHEFEDGRELNQAEIDRMLEIQANGHEIAHHGYKHKNAVEYVEKYGGQRWIDEEILPLFQWMKDKKSSINGEGFKEAISFIYPGSKYNNETNRLLQKYFKVFRAASEKNNLVGFESTGFCPSICIDVNYFPYVSHVKKILKYVKRSNQNIVLMCHSILPENVEWNSFNWGKDSEKDSKYRITPDDLNTIIKEAKKIGLEFYTLSEIAGVATFIDKNFENRVRKLLNMPKASHKWIYIKDLVSIKELDLSSAQLSNLAGIEYFINLEKLNLKNNKIRNIQLIEKLEKLKFVDIRNNLIEKNQLVEILEDKYRTDSIKIVG